LGRGAPGDARLTVTTNVVDLAGALDRANLAVLVSALVHLTGDESLFDRWDEASFYRLRNPTAMDEATAEEIRAHASSVLADPDRWPPRTPAPEELLRIATFCAGEPIDPAYVPLILDESGFDGSDPRRFEWERAPDPETLTSFHVAVIGAGLGGVCAAIRLGQAGIPYTIFEKNDGLGGVWWENDYPDLRVDVPNLFYSYSFAPNAEWSSFYSPRDELQAYVERCAREHGVLEHVRFGHEVDGADYDAGTARWTLRVRPSEDEPYTFGANALLSAVGMLNRPHVPDLPGLESFAGPWFHSSRWPADLDVSGKRVGVIGTGASSVQLVPAIAPSVEHLDVFQRSKHWMMPNPAYLQGLSDADRWLIGNVPYYAGWFRFLEMWNSSDRIYPAFRVDPEWPAPERSISAQNEKMRVLMTRHLERELGDDEELVRRTLPDYPPLGKRMLQDGNWFATLRRGNVDLVVEPIERIEADGVVTRDGVTHALDVLVLATGFHARRFLWPMEITGPAGRLHERWGDEPRAYLGITVPGFPNLFCLYGPNTNPVVGSVIFMLECQADYVIRCLAELIGGGFASMECRQDVHDEYNDRVDAEHEQMVWRHPKVHSYYNNAQGRVVTNAPWRLIDYWRMTRRLDPADFVFVPDHRIGTRREEAS
jgi:4-hydroxyacetophenone monooxygenase